MKKLIRKLSKVSPSSSTYSHLRSSSGRRSSFKSPGPDVPAGHFPVYAGLDHMERFVVNADLLRHPVFLQLLDRSAQEYGYDQTGVLKIPIQAADFQRLLDSLRLGRPLTTLDDVVSSSIQVR